MEPNAPRPNRNNVTPPSAQDTQKLSDDYAPPGVGAPSVGPYHTWHDEPSTAATVPMPQNTSAEGYGSHLGYVAPQQPSAGTLLPADARAVHTPPQPMPPVPHNQEHVPPQRAGRPNAAGAYGWAFSSYFAHAGVMFGHSVMPALLFLGSHIAGVAFGWSALSSISFTPEEQDPVSPGGLNPGAWLTLSMALGAAFWLALWSFSLAVFNAGFHINAGYRPGFWSSVFRARWLNYWLQAGFFVVGCAVLLGVVFFRLPELIDAYTKPLVEWLTPFMTATDELPAELLRVLLSSAVVVAIPVLIVAMATWYLPIAILSGDANCLTGIFRSIYIGFRYPWLTFCLIVFAVLLHAVAGLLCFLPTLCLVVPVIWLATTRAYCQVTGR